MSRSRGRQTPDSRSRLRRAGALHALPLMLVLSGIRPSATPGQTAHPLSVSVGTHALTVPWHPGLLMDGLNPAVMVGTGRAWRSGEPWRLSIGFNLGAFRDHWWMSGISLEPELRLGRTWPGGLHADVGIGLGYLHYFWRRPTLELKDGAYVPAANSGRPSLILPLSLTLGYRGGTSNPLTVSPFVTGRWVLQGLFLPEVPAMTHLFLMGGAHIQRAETSGGAG
ncbi:MAG: hypothetical protein LJF04_09320 [Gemmatimonadetes bacterium]|nr:hypothetical protein [Gemmatimonadota bacterium]